ncbi:MAG: hypothetical protein HYW26_01270 [Candidatus Aenigmarchaeota archaeon]|nr:hypothetical protein [Candidatus Aenigmarchaeota archaeon]
MNTPLTAWGVVLLLLFAGAHYLAAGGYNVSWLWIGIAVVINILNMWVGKQMKGSPKGMMAVWMSAGLFGFLATLAIAFEVIPLSAAVLMSLWLLLLGAAMFAGGHAAHNPLSDYAGLVLVVSSLFVPAFGSQWQFMAGALLLGVFGIVNGYLAK